MPGAHSPAPSPAEVARCLEMMKSLQKQDGAQPDQATKYFCLMMLNLNEFVFLE